MKYAFHRMDKKYNLCKNRIFPKIFPHFSFTRQRYLFVRLSGVQLNMVSTCGKRYTPKDGTVGDISVSPRTRYNFFFDIKKFQDLDFRSKSLNLIFFYKIYNLQQYPTKQ